MPQGKMYGANTQYFPGYPKETGANDRQATSKRVPTTLMNSGTKANATIKGEIGAISSKGIKNKPQMKVKDDQVSSSQHIEMAYGHSGEKLAQKMKANTARKKKSLYA